MRASVVIAQGVFLASSDAHHLELGDIANCLAARHVSLVVLVDVVVGHADGDDDSVCRQLDTARVHDAGPDLCLEQIDEDGLVVDVELFLANEVSESNALVVAHGLCLSSCRGGLSLPPITKVYHRMNTYASRNSQKLTCN